MKRFDEMTDAEVLALTDDEVAYAVDYACAEAGAPLMPPDPGDAPIEPAAEPDVTAYRVGDAYFTDALVAGQIAADMMRQPRLVSSYAPGGSYKHRLMKPTNDEVAVSVERGFSPNTWDLVRKQVTAHEAARKQWDEDRKAWSAAVEARGSASEWVHERVQRVRADERERVRTLAEFDRYLELARGDEAIARAFLLKAHPEAAKHLPPGEAEAPDSVAPPEPPSATEPAPEIPW